MTKVTSYKGKKVEIKCKILDDGSKLQEVTFDDGSQVKYITFLKGGKMDINGEEFEMPVGTIVETKSANGRVFSQLIQTPDMQKKVINKPEYIDEAEKALTQDIQPKQENSKSAVMPTPKYILDLLGKANSARVLLEFSKNNSKTNIEEINYLEQCIKEGKLPRETTITGVNTEGGKILTIQGNNCKYEVCASEMQIIDDNNEIKMIARYESGRESEGLWIVTYKNNKPIKGFHYASWDVEKPLEIVNYTYENNNIVTITTINNNGNKNDFKQLLPDKFCINIEKGFKIVSNNEKHIGSTFENQKPFNLTLE